MKSTIEGFAAVTPGGVGCMQIRRCRSCNASVIWAKTRKEKWMVLDAAPNGRGKFIVSSTEPPECETFDEGNMLHANRYRFAAHWGSCPQAENWKRK
jgi:hypothetical protein